MPRGGPAANGGGARGREGETTQARRGMAPMQRTHHGHASHRPLPPRNCEWFYIDNNGKQQGPAPTEQIAKWIDKWPGTFKESTRLKAVDPRTKADHGWKTFAEYGFLPAPPGGWRAALGLNGVFGAPARSHAARSHAAVTRRGHTPRPVWLDCDPGHDDAMALLLATANDAVALLGVSTVHGNQTLGKVTENALRVLHLLGHAHVPVFPGAPKPLMHDAKACPEIHGESGLDGPAIEPSPAQPRTDKPAIVAMYEALKEAHAADPSQRPCIIATGCLTNVALLLSVYPDVESFAEIVFMGGAVGEGNTGSSLSILFAKRARAAQACCACMFSTNAATAPGPVAEFNIQNDAAAAHVVFESGQRMPVTMVPLEVTHTAVATKDVCATISRHGRIGAVVGEWLAFFAATYRDVFGFDDGPPVHDPVAVAFLIDPSMFTDVRHVRADVETSSPLSIGQTVVDVRGKYGRGATNGRNVNVCLAMDVAEFWRLIDDAVAKAEAHTNGL